MNRSLRSAAFVILVAAFTGGCREHVTDGCPGCPPPPPALGTPEQVLEALQLAYRRRDIDLYASLLAPEFVFKFIPSDVQDLGLEKDFWTRDKDSTGTAYLFQSNQVKAIRLEMTYGPAFPTDDLSFPPGTMQIHVDQMQLEVDETDGTTWLVTEQQDFFFRRGLESAGEDPERWYILEWHDLPLSTKIAGAPRIQVMTWGGLKARYR